MERKHEWNKARFTGAVTCTRCGLLPMDDEDIESPCETETVIKVGSRVEWEGRKGTILYVGETICRVRFDGCELPVARFIEALRVIEGEA